MASGFWSDSSPSSTNISTGGQSEKSLSESVSMLEMLCDLVGVVDDLPLTCC